MKVSKQDWVGIRQEYADRLARHGITLSIRRAWGLATDGRWVVLPSASESESAADKWWFGFDEKKLADRDAAGAILLCRDSDGTLLDFGLPIAFLHKITRDLVVRRGTHHRQFNVVRRGARFVLGLKGGREVDITDRRGDVSWLGAPTKPAAASRLEDAPTPYGEEAAPEPPRPRNFFARFRGGKLEPVDPQELEEGAAYIVEVRPVDWVPSFKFERFALANPARGSYPPDLAAQHDHYLYGTPKR